MINYLQDIAKPFSDYVYLMVFFSEDDIFIKVGISNSPNKRVTSILKSLNRVNNDNYKGVVAYAVGMDSRHSSRKKEDGLHQLLEGYRLYPDRKFDGHTECFTFDALIQLHSKGAHGNTSCRDFIVHINSLVENELEDYLV